MPLEEPFVHEDWEGRHVACTLSCSSNAHTNVYAYVHTIIHRFLISAYSYTKMFQYKTHIKSMAYVMTREALKHPKKPPQFRWIATPGSVSSKSIEGPSSTPSW